MTIEHLKQWWILVSYETKAEEDEFIIKRLSKQPLCRSFVLDYLSFDKFRLQFLWYSMVKENEWMTVKRLTDVVVEMHEEENKLYVNTETSKYVFQKLDE